MSTKYECPNCNYVVEFKTERVKEDVICPMCSHKFVLGTVSFRDTLPEPVREPVEPVEPPRYWYIN